MTENIDYRRWSKRCPTFAMPTVVYFDQRLGAALVNVFCAKKPKNTFKVQITLKIKISTSVWSAQHPNAGQNTADIKKICWWINLKLNLINHLT